jgi:imidazolonepropionase-like amidohydrolase
MSPGESMRIAITQAHIVVGASETIDDGVVVLDGNRIESVSADESASGRGYDLTVDLTGRTSIPGMIDVHSHMAGGDKTLPFNGEPRVRVMCEGPRVLAAGPGVWPTGSSGAHLEPNVGGDSDADAHRACASWSSAAWT